MSDPENVGNDATDPAEVPTPAPDQEAEDKSLLQKAAEKLGLGGDTPSEDPADENTDPENAPIVTEEALEASAEEEEQDRKAAIRQNMGGNLGDKCARLAETNAPDE